MDTEKPIYRMSESGQCPRALGARRLRYDPMPELEANIRIMREGSRHENLVIEDLTEDGYHIYDRQREVTIETPLLILQGHIDGIASKNGDTRILEIKALGKFTFQKYRSKGLELFPEYQSQITCYAEATNLPILYVVKDRDSGELIKTKLSKPPLHIDSILDKLNVVELHVMDRALPDAEFLDNNKCYWCRFKFLCSKPEPKQESEEVNIINLVEAAKIYTDAQQLRKEAEEKIDWAKEVLIGHAKENKISKYRVSDLSVSYRGQTTKEYLDSVLLKKDSPEIYQKYVRHSKPYDDFSIRRLKE